MRRVCGLVLCVCLCFCVLTFTVNRKAGKRYGDTAAASAAAATCAAKRKEGRKIHKKTKSNHGVNARMRENEKGKNKTTER